MVEPCGLSLLADYGSDTESVNSSTSETAVTLQEEEGAPAAGSSARRVAAPPFTITRVRSLPVLLLVVWLTFVFTKLAKTLFTRVLIYASRCSC